MSEEQAVVANEAPVQKKAKVFIKKEPLNFAMDFWEDERQARKHIKENLLLIQQKSNEAGVKAHFGKHKDIGDGFQSMEVQFAHTEKVEKKDGSIETRHVFSGNDYIRVTFDPTRKFPKAPKKEEDDGEKKKANG